MGLEGTSPEGEVQDDSDESFDEDLLAPSLWVIILMGMKLNSVEAGYPIPMVQDISNFFFPF